jgi:Fe-S-cluster containining protein
MAAALRFPYTIRQDGTCEKLTGNQCSVYEDRPLLCRVDDLTDLLGDQKEAAIRDNIQACNAAITAAGLDPSYLIQA